MTSFMAAVRESGLSPRCGVAVPYSGATSLSDSPSPCNRSKWL